MLPFFIERTLTSEKSNDELIALLEGAMQAEPRSSRLLGEISDKKFKLRASTGSSLMPVATGVITDTADGSIVKLEIEPRFKLGKLSLIFTRLLWILLLAFSVILLIAHGLEGFLSAVSVCLFLFLADTILTLLLFYLPATSLIHTLSSVLEIEEKGDDSL